MKIGLILSGCGVNDGTEIHEAIITMLCLDMQKVEIKYFAPDIKQTHVINHISGEIMPEERNIMIESARIARGSIEPLETANLEDLDAIILPGGSGAMKNLSNIFIDPKSPEIESSVKKAITFMHQTKKPIGAICISPVIVANALSSYSPDVTIGNDPNIASMIKLFGGTHINCKVNDIVVDEKNIIVSTPAYMIAKGPAEVYQGISKLVDKIIELCRK